VSLRLTVIGAVLLSSIVAQEQPAPARPEPVLPFSDRALPIGERTRIVVDVVRDGDAWFVLFSGKAYGLAGEALDAAFPVDLDKAVRSSKAATPAAFLVRADAKAPYRVPYLAVKAAAEAGLTRILFATRKDAASTTENAVLWQLPGPDDPPDPDGLPDIRLAARLKRGELIRTFEIDPKAIPPGADGDQKLEGMLRAKRDEQRRLWKLEIPVVVEAEGAVPWQHVVDLVSLALRSGSTRIELDLAAPKEDPTADRRRARTAENIDPGGRRGHKADVVEPSKGELTSQPTQKITLPRSTRAIALEEKNPIEVWIFAVETASAATRPADRWRWQVKQRIYRCDQAGWKGLTVNLAQRGGVVGNGASSRSLLIRADARAPYGLMQKTIEAAALARIYKIHIAAVRDASVPVESLKCWLPLRRDETEAGSVASEIRLLLSWNVEAGRLERLLGQSVYPSTPEGDAKLESAVRASLAATRTEGRLVPLVIDAGPRVPCQAIVDAVDLSSKLGIEQVEFGLGAEMW
jgi:biopolymer transport protein ExbD